VFSGKSLGQLGGNWSARGEHRNRGEPFPGLKGQKTAEFVAFMAKAWLHTRLSQHNTLPLATAGMEKTRRNLQPPTTAKVLAHG